MNDLTVACPRIFLHILLRSFETQMMAKARQCRGLRGSTGFYSVSAEIAASLSLPEEQTTYVTHTICQ